MRLKIQNEIRFLWQKKTRPITRLKTVKCVNCKITYRFFKIRP